MQQCCRFGFGQIAQASFHNSVGVAADGPSHPLCFRIDSTLNLHRIVRRFVGVVTAQISSLIHG